VHVRTPAAKRLRASLPGTDRLTAHAAHRHEASAADPQSSTLGSDGGHTDWRPRCGAPPTHGRPLLHRPGAPPWPDREPLRPRSVQGRASASPRSPERPRLALNATRIPGCECRCATVVSVESLVRAPLGASCRRRTCARPSTSFQVKSKSVAPRRTHRQRIPIARPVIGAHAFGVDCSSGRGVLRAVTAHASSSRRCCHPLPARAFSHVPLAAWG
jgi:hypothetical protein